LIDERTGHLIASTVELSLTRRARPAGSRGHVGIDPTVALVLAPCSMVHTAFLRCPIDVLFVGRDGRAVRLVHSLQPWRATAAAGAYAAIELAAGALARSGVEVGDRLLLEPPALPQAIQQIA
jgi:uncharacterized membrane protein (UPF0127 family)